jgi:hypothetical protein
MIAVAKSNATFADLLMRKEAPTQAQLAAHLDALSVDERIEQCRALGKRCSAACGISAPTRRRSRSRI